MRSEHYRVLYTIYSVKKGFSADPIIIQQLAEKLGFSMDEYDKYQQLIELVTYLENEYLVRRESYGLVLTIYGINEIENSILEPEKPTTHFSVNMSRFVDVDESVTEFIRKMRKARKDYLIEAYNMAGGYETAIVSPFALKDKLELEDDHFKRVYYYLIDAGLIKRIHSDGISLTHEGKLEVENERVASVADSSLWSSNYPAVTFCDDLAILLDEFNISSKIKFGIEIFKNNAKLYVDLRNSINYLNKDSKDKNAFITCILSIASIIGDVKTDAIQVKIKNEDRKGSINMINELFDLNKVLYEKENFATLRKLVRLRSTTPPIHLGEEESNEILKFIGVAHPVTDWAEAADKYLKLLLETMKSITAKIK